MSKNNFLNLLQWHANKNGKGKHVFLNSRKKILKEVLHSDLVRKAFGLSHLLNLHIEKTDICYIVSSDQYTQLLIFYAVIASGAIPIIGSHLPRFGAGSEIINKLDHWKRLYNKNLKAISDIDLNFENTIVLDDVSKIIDAYKPVVDLVIDENDILYLQSSSATTGQAKAIAISHKNIFTNTEQIKNGLVASQNEVFISWLPLYHDMGLVGAELFSLRYDYDLILMPPYEFTRQPRIWLDAISSYRGTITAIPAFAIDYILERDEENYSTLDLSSLHSICIGAEPVRMDAIEKFVKVYESHGLKIESFVPCYGLAESTLAATFKPSQKIPQSLYVLQSSIKQGARVQLANKNQPDTVRITSVGKLVQGVSCFIEHDNQVLEGDLACGEITLIGPSITQGYMNSPGFVSWLPDNKLKTGDIGFLYNNELYILDRDKNIIIQNGVNYIASEIESFVSEKFKIEKRRVIIFETEVNSDNKRIIAAIEFKGSHELVGEVRNICKEICQSSIVQEVYLIKRGFIEVTSSGKKRYFIARQKFKNGNYSLITSENLEVEGVYHE